MTSEELAAITELITEYTKIAEDARPHVQTVLNAVASYGPELDEFFTRLMNWSARKNVERFQYYRSQMGITDEFAIALVLGDMNTLKQLGQTTSKK